MIRSKVNFLCQVLSKYDEMFEQLESQVVSTNDVIATVGIKGYKKFSRSVIRQSLTFGTQWEVEIPHGRVSFIEIKLAIRDELQSDWWLKNWINNKIAFDRAEREENWLHEQRYADGLLSKKMIY